MHYYLIYICDDGEPILYAPNTDIEYLLTKLIDYLEVGLHDGVRRELSETDKSDIRRDKCFVTGDLSGWRVAQTRKMP